MTELPRRTAARSKGLWLAAALCCALATVALPVDHSVADFARTLRMGAPVIIVELAGGLGQGVVLGLVFILLMAFYGEERTGAAGLLSALAAGLTADALRGLFQRVRPDGGPFSFPSAHTACAFAAAVVLARRFPRFRYAFYLGAAAVAASHVLLLKHYPSDVLAGAAVGVVAGLAGIAAAERLSFLDNARVMAVVKAALMASLVISVVLVKHWPGPLASVMTPVLLLVIARRAAALWGPRLINGGQP